MKKVQVPLLVENTAHPRLPWISLRATPPAHALYTDHREHPHALHTLAYQHFPESTSMVFSGIFSCYTVSPLGHDHVPFTFGFSISIASPRTQQAPVHLRSQETGPYCTYSLEKRNDYLQKGRQVRMGCGRNSKSRQEKKKLTMI